MWAQALTVSPAAGVRGSVASVVISSTFPAGSEPVALQWELSYPSPQLGLENGDLAAGSAAARAGKSLTCVGRAENAGTYVYRCILAGGGKEIPNGAAAVAAFRIRPQARPGPATVLISSALAVSA